MNTNDTTTTPATTHTTPDVERIAGRSHGTHEVSGDVSGVPTIPVTVDEVTPGWLTGALHAGGIEAVVDALEIEPVGVGVGIMSLLFRLTPDYASGSGPRSIILKMAPPYEQVRAVAAGYGFYEREVEIYRTLGDKVGLRPPALHYADHDAATDDFVVLMEDFRSLRSCDQLDGCSPADAREIVKALAGHHATWWADDRLETLPFVHPWADPPYPQYHLASTTQQWPVVMERFGHLVPDRIRVLGDRWAEIGPPLMEDGPNHPCTLCHGDVRLDNVFFRDGDDDPVSVVDWQIAGVAPGSSDLGYFMSQSLTVADRRAHEQDLVRLYHDTLVAGGVTDYPFGELWDDYRRTILFCLSYAMGVCAVELANDRAEALATVMLERSIAAIIDLDADELAP